MQGRCTAGDQPFAQLGDEVGGEFADAGGIVAVGAHALADPARDLGAAGFGEALELAEVGDRHDAGDDRHLDAQRARIVDETEIRVGVVEVLGDRAVGTGIDLGLEVAQVDVRVLGLRMGFRIGRDFDVEMVAVFAADQFHQFAGVAQVAAADHAGGRVAAQRDHAVAAEGAVQLEQGADLLAVAADAGDVRHADHAMLAAQALHGFRGMAEGGAAGAEGHRHELRRMRLELQHAAVQLRALFVGLGRIELEAERQHAGGHGNRCRHSIHRFIRMEVISSEFRAVGNENGRPAAPVVVSPSNRAISSGNAPACTGLRPPRRGSRPATG